MMTRRVLLTFTGAALLAAGIVAVTMLSGTDVPAVAHAGTAGSIRGTVQYGGSAPQRAVLQMAADPFCVTAHAGQTVLSDQLVVNDNNTVRWTFLHLSPAGSGSLPAGPAETVELDQIGCMYSPHVLGMQAGATIRVVNSDQTLHNVNAQPRNNQAFNVAQPIPGMAIERVFQNPEIMIPMRCDVHPWMQAYVGVVPHGFFSVSGDDGSFSMDGVPPGDYVLEAWHESLGTQTMNVTVREGETATADFTFGADQ